MSRLSRSIRIVTDKLLRATSCLGEGGAGALSAVSTSSSSFCGPASSSTRATPTGAMSAMGGHRGFASWSDRDDSSDRAAVSLDTDGEAPGPAGAAAADALGSSLSSSSSGFPDAVQDMVRVVEHELIEAAVADAWYNTEAVSRLILQYHDSLALPWWAAIMVTTLTVRLCLSFPIALVSAKRVQRTIDAMPELRPITEEMKQFNPLHNPNAVKDIDRLTELRKEMKAVYKKYGADPTGPIKVLAAQGFISGSIFVGLRKLVMAKVPSMTSGGVLWFSDLTVADPYYILPAMVGGCFFMMIRRNINPDAGDMSALQQDNPMMSGDNIKKMQYWMSAAFIPVMAFMPAAMNLYYLGSMCIGVVQASVLRNPTIRVAMGLPPKAGTPSGMIYKGGVPVAAAGVAAAAAAGKK